MFQVRFQAFQAASAFALLHEKEQAILKHMEPLLPHMVAILAESVEKSDDEALLKCLIEMAETTPKFLRSHLEPIVEMCMKVCLFRPLWRKFIQSLHLASKSIKKNQTRSFFESTRDDSKKVSKFFN